MGKFVLSVICCVALAVMSGCSGKLSISKEIISVPGFDNAYTSGEGNLVKSKKINSFYYQIIADYEGPKVRKKMTLEQCAGLPGKDLPLERLCGINLASNAKSGIIRAWASNTTETEGGIPVFAYSLTSNEVAHCSTNLQSVFVTKITKYSQDKIKIYVSLTHQLDDTVPIDVSESLISMASSIYVSIPVANESVNSGLRLLKSRISPYFKSSVKNTDDIKMFWQGGTEPVLLAYLPIVYEDTDDEKYLVGFISFRIVVRPTIFNTNYSCDTGMPMFADRTVSIIPDQVTDKNETRLSQKIEEYRKIFAEDAFDRDAEIGKMENELMNNYELSVYDIAFCMHLALSANKRYNVAAKETLPGVYGQMYADVARSCGIDVKMKKDLAKNSRIDAEASVAGATNDIDSLNKIFSEYIKNNKDSYDSHDLFIKDLFSILSKVTLFNRDINFTHFESTKDYYNDLVKNGMKTTELFIEEEKAKIKIAFAPILTFIERFLNTMRMSSATRSQLLAGELFADQVFMSCYIDELNLVPQLTQYAGSDLAQKLSPLRIQRYGCIYSTSMKGHVYGKIQSVGQIYGKSDYRGMNCAIGVVDGKVKHINIFYKVITDNDSLRISGITMMESTPFDSIIKKIDPQTTSECKSFLDTIPTEETNSATQ